MLEQDSISTAVKRDWFYLKIKKYFVGDPLAFETTKVSSGEKGKLR